MKGIILAGGSGGRLYPMTKAMNKHLIPIYDKPLIYYPMSVLMLAGIREILVVTAPDNVATFQKLFEDGSDWGCRIAYQIQEEPRGLALALIQAESFISEESVYVVLGDNFFYGMDLTKLLMEARGYEEGACIYAYPVKDPIDFGVVEFDHRGRVISIEEKPVKPKSNFAIPGLYFYDHNAVTLAKTLSPSPSGELEITDLNRKYLERNELITIEMGRGMAWFDAGTPSSLLKASEFVETIQTRQGFYIACLEEIAWRRGFIDERQLRTLGEGLQHTDYGKYFLFDEK